MGDLRGGTTIGGYIIWHAGNLTNKNVLDLFGTDANGKLTWNGSAVGAVQADGTLQTNLNADKLDGNEASAFLLLSGGTMSGTLNMGNNTISGVNHIQISDPGPSEGIEWVGGTGWKIYESPDDLVTNSGGNLQFVVGSTRKFTIGSTLATFVVPVTGDFIFKSYTGADPASPSTGQAWIRTDI